MKKWKVALFLCGLVVYFTFTGSTSAFAMHIMEGFLPVGWAIFWWLVFAVFDHRYAFTNSDYTRASGTKAAHCAVRGIYVCAVRLKNSIRYWEQLTSNGGRTRCGAVWPMNDGSDGKHCIAVSSVIAGTWRIDDIRGKCHVHGSRRPACGLRHLSF